MGLYYPTIILLLELLMVPKIKIEDTTGSGEKITLTIEGSEISEERVVQVLQMLRLLKSSGGKHT